MAVRRYDETVLHELLNKYERSLLYKERNLRSQTIAFAVRRNTLPDYFDESSLQYETIHEQLLELEQKGYIQLIWKHNKAGHILEKCILCTGQAEEIYAFLHRRPRKEREAELLKICAQNQGCHPILDGFLFWIRQRIEAGESIKTFVNAEIPCSLAETCRLILEILQNQEEVFWREFSVRFFQDSKTAEKELLKAASIISRFSQETNPLLAQLSGEQLLEEFQIYKNPSWVMIKGCGCFFLESAQEGQRQENHEINLSVFSGGIGLSSTDIRCVRWRRMEQVRCVVTIENLTSFHRWNEKGSLAIYLGGYHNRVKREFLQKLYTDCPDSVVFEHFGDIDCGGFHIWRDLCEKTAIPFQLRWMDQETFLDHLRFAKNLTANDRSELERMQNNPFFAEQRELFASMIEKGKKLEQESIRCGDSVRAVQ